MITVKKMIFGRNNKQRIKISRAQRIFDVCNVLFMCALSLVMVYPIWHVVMASLSDNNEIIGHVCLLYKPLGFNFNTYALMMKNPMIITGYINTIIIVVVVLIQKPKDYLAIVAFCVIGSIGLTLLGTDHIKDLTNRETTIVTAKYVRYLSSGREATRYTRKMIFTVGGEEIGLYAPILTKRKYYLEMEEGKRYKIEYFNHTKIIKCYELIN